MTHRSFDTIILGLGAMGSSTAFYLAQTGKKVLGLEQFTCAHNRGSSHGRSRLIRQAYFEHPDYVPLLKRSYVLWDEISKLSGRQLLHRTGVVIYGSEKGGQVLPGIRRSSRDHHIPIDEMSGNEARRRFPLLCVPNGFEAIFEPGAGYLEVENCVYAYCEEATKLGARLQFEEEVLSWASYGNRVEVRTDRGNYEAESLVVTAGAWSSGLLGLPEISLQVRRVPLFWFNANENYSGSRGFPCWAYDLPYGFIYGFPWVEGEGIKIAPHIPGDIIDNPSSFDRTPTDKELEPVLRCLNECLPDLNSDVIHSALCLYTMSKDSHFIIDLHPHYRNVAFACGFSGHGFKFSSVVGEILSELIREGKTKHPISFLRIRSA